MRPPCASTRPRAIARPRPAPRAARAASPRQKRSNMRAAPPRRGPRRCPRRDLDLVSAAARRRPRPGRRTACGEARSSSRLQSTRSTFSGAQRTLAAVDVARSSRDVRRAASASTPRRHDSTTVAQRRRAQLERRARRRRFARARRDRRRARERAHLLAERGQVLVGLGEPVLDRLEHRLHRRERRAEIVARPRDELPAGVEEPLEACRHLVERAARGRRARRAALGRARAQVAARERAPRVAHRSTRARSAGRARAPTTTAPSADAAATARIFRSSPMWNITQPDSEHRARAAAAPRASASPTSCRRTVGSAAGRPRRRAPRRARRRDRRRRARARSRHEPVADAPDGLEMPRVVTGRPRPSRAAGGCAR